MTGQEPDTDLLAGVRLGDEQAFLALYRRFGPPIYRFAVNMTGSPVLAEDVTQDVFLALIRENFGYVPERGTLSGYLFGIARKLVLRHIERGHGTFELEIDDADWTRPELIAFPDPMADLLRREGIEELRRAVLSLPRRYREVVVLCDLEEIAYEDAAGLLGCPLGTVRSRLHRARGLLLEKLQQRLDSKPRLKSLHTARSLI
jgi:RNA polymerase sigma-70 factor (ECF subfamily)